MKLGFSQREEHRLMMSRNRLLRISLGLKCERVTGDCTKVHNEEFHNFYSSPHIMMTTNSECEIGGA
jgi:hypothetical protein